MTDSPVVQLRIQYSKPSIDPDDNRKYRVMCSEDDADADQVEIAVNMRGHWREMRFTRNTFTGHNDRGQYQREGEWPLEKGQLQGMLQAAFEQGVAYQRKATRDLFEKVMGIS